MNQGLRQLGNEFQPEGAALSRRCTISHVGLATHLAAVQHHDPAAAHHGVQAMGDDEGGAAAKCTANGLLDETIRLGVDGCCRLVQDEDLKETTQAKPGGLINYHPLNRLDRHLYI